MRRYEEVPTEASKEEANLTKYPPRTRALSAKYLRNTLPLTCFSPHILIHIWWVLEIQLPLSLWYQVSWGTTFSTGCKSKDSHVSKENWAVSRKERACQCGTSVCIQNAVTRITEDSQRPTELFWKMWFNHSIRMCYARTWMWCFLESLKPPRNY